MEDEKTIQKAINSFLSPAQVKNLKDGVKDALKIVKSEFQREPTKEVSDTRAVKIIQELINSEKERIDRIDTFKKGGSIDKANGIRYIHILTGFIPIQVGEEEIRDWIVENIDFSEYKNPMQAIKFVVEHFGTRTNGGTVKGVIEDING